MTLIRLYVRLRRRLQRAIAQAEAEQMYQRPRKLPPAEAEALRARFTERIRP